MLNEIISLSIFVTSSQIVPVAMSFGMTRSSQKNALIALRQFHILHQQIRPND